MNHIRAYLRASTNEQDASRAKQSLIEFAAQHGREIAGFYEENESGAKLARPELASIIKASAPGDIILVEQIDRISRLTEADWQKLRSDIETRQIYIVSLDLPPSWEAMTGTKNGTNDITAGIMRTITRMLLDMLALFARKDYEDRRRRQAQGVQRAKAEGKYKGRPANQELRDKVALLLADGNKSQRQIAALVGCSKATVTAVAKELKEASGFAG